MGEREAIRCKHCGGPEVGKRVTMILRYDTTMLGNAIEQDVKDMFDNMGSKDRGEALNSEDIIDVVIEDGLYCFVCDKYQ